MAATMVCVCVGGGGGDEEGVCVWSDYAVPFLLRSLRNKDGC